MDVALLSSEFSGGVGYTYSDLCKYLGVVVIPYQLSTISILEYYRLNIPLFFPSRELLSEWHSAYDVKWERIYGWPERLTSTSHDGNSDIPNPNDNTAESFRYWIQFADWYHLPHIQIFENFTQFSHECVQI